MTDTIRVQEGVDIQPYLATADTFKYCSAEAGAQIVLTGQQEDVLYRVFDINNEVVSEYTGIASGFEPQAEGRYTIRNNFV